MTVKELCSVCKYAANGFLGTDTKQKNSILTALKELLINNTAALLMENGKDMRRAEENGRNAAFLDRLALNEKRIYAMAEGLDAIVSLSDPVGETVEEYTLKNGLRVKKVRTPIGVIGIIFEARPNVAIDAAALCIKSGNGVVLRGSRESSYSVAFLVSLIKKALTLCGASENLVTLIEGEERELSAEMLKQEQFIDVVIPRGGEALKKFVLENAAMPVIASSGGNCHIYVAKSADIEMAVNVVLNAKINRPATCNAAETLLFDKSLPSSDIVKILTALKEKGVLIKGTKDIKRIFPVEEVEEDEFYKEYDDMVIKTATVNGISAAIAHINQYGTRHSDAILTNDEKEAERFCREVDSAAVYVNASTRFTDGFELGLGAEMGISTQKLHVRGPIGLRELTSVKYTVYGSGQVRK